MSTVNYPRRQRNRRLIRSLEYAAIALGELSVAGVALILGWSSGAIALVLVAAVFGIRARRSFGLARRSGAGARSEQRVRSALGELEFEGWKIRHALGWRDGGDIDHIAVAPPTAGVAFAIETKTRRYRPGDLARVTGIAQWLIERRPRRGNRNAVPVLCLAGARGIERWEEGVAVVSLDRLVPLLSRLAGTTRKPLFLR